MAVTVGGQTHELKGLSGEDSWKLFEKMTQKERHEIEELHGEEILKKCAAVPLAIKVVGSSLRGQAKYKWMNMAKADLASESNEDIMPVLKISYYDLPLDLKRCFSYCAVFPKDYEINKEELIYLWMAQGFINPSGQRLEDVGEEYFMNLLERCFFQDVKRAHDGEIISCKMHDLIHDLAQNIVGAEMMSLKDSNSNFRADVCHVFIDFEIENTFKFCTQMKRMRTLLKKSFSYYGEVEISKARNLRALSWHTKFMKKTPSMIGELMHLRYLDFSQAKFYLLPASIANLFNLQILKLQKCDRLEKLPKDLAKLVNLRCLDLQDCDSLKYMPPRMGNLTCLQKLTRFVLGNNKKNKDIFSRRVRISGLDELKCLKSLACTLQISIMGDWAYDEAEVKKGRYIVGMEQLKGIEIEFNHTVENNNAEALLEGLQPNRNLQMFKLSKYPYEGFSSCWLRGGLSQNLNSRLPNLVEICIFSCYKLKHLPSMSQLPKLRVLKLEDLDSLEYVESNSNEDGAPTELSVSRQGDAHEEVFFPSLQILELVKLKMLRAWGLHSNSYEFRQLNNLKIHKCDKLSTFPLCPKGVLDIRFSDDEEALSFRSNSGYWVEINSVNVKYIIKSLPQEILHHHPYLVIRRTKNIEGLLLATKEVFRNGRMPSLLSLEIYNCAEMRRLSELKAIREPLTALETLQLAYLPNLEFDYEDEDVDSSRECTTREVEIREEDDNVTAFAVTWRFFASTLRHLELYRIPKLVTLPSEMMCLTSLLSLKIIYCENLEVLPAWLSYFKSLHVLVIDSCVALKTLPQEIFNLTSLETLELRYLPELKLEWEEDDEDGRRACQTLTLRHLILYNLPKLVELPRAMHIFTSLNNLEIRGCVNLIKLPAWIDCFTSLHSLAIEQSTKLEALPQEMCRLTSLQYLLLNDTSEELEIRCRKPRGADWPKIQHIPNITINNQSLQGEYVDFYDE